MPTYPCEKCGKVFKRKSGFTDHQSKKVDCSQNTIIDTVIETKVAEKVKEAVRAIATPKADVTADTKQAFFEDIHNLLWNKAGLNPERALEHMTFFFAYRLIEQQADALNLPQECRWSYLTSLTNENDLFETIRRGTAHFRKPDSVTRPFFKPHEIQKADIVFEIVEQVKRIPHTLLQEADTLGDIFEYMLGRGMSTMSDEGQYFTNRAICKLAFKKSYEIKKVLRRTDGSLCTFADWFCGTGGFPAEFVKGVKAHVPDVNWKTESGAVYCQDMNLSSVTTTLLNLLILTGIPFSDKTIRSANSFTDPITTGTGAPFAGLAVDYCFMNPPYGGDKTKGKEYKFAYSKTVKDEAGAKTKRFFVNQEIQSIGIEDDDKVSAGVQLSMATLSADGGVCAIVLPQGFFFGASKKCVELRKKIAEEYKIHYVVDIASGSFLNTGTKTSMMVFQKGVGATEKVKFIGLDEKPLVEATLEELRVKHYSLNFKQYLPQSVVEVEGFEMVKLGDVAEWQMGKRIVKDQVETGKYPVYGGGGITFYTNSSNRSDINCKISREGMSEANCVLMISGDYHQNSQGMTVVSKDTGKVLNSYLWNWLVVHKKDVYECGQGTAQKAINMVMLNDLDVPLPSLERQAQIVEAIDGWAGLAQQEEVALKILEKQMMFQVKELGRGQARVKLGDMLKDVKYPKHPTEYGKESGNYRFHTGAESTKLYTNAPDIDDLVIIVNRTNGSGKCHIFIDSKCSVATQTITFASKIDITTAYLYYYFKSDISVLEAGYQGACHKNLTSQYINDLEIPLPPLTEQQTLQSDFDEIRHKHAKIAEYKAKAQAAIQRLIPGADHSEDAASTSTTNEVITP